VHTLGALSPYRLTEIARHLKVNKNDNAYKIKLDATYLSISHPAHLLAEVMAAITVGVVYTCYRNNRTKKKSATENAIR
jgi:hypothetical protein